MNETCRTVTEENSERDNDDGVGILMELSDMLSARANKLATKRSRYSSYYSSYTVTRSTSEEGLS